jgi:hypothetical protein
MTASHDGRELLEQIVASGGHLCAFRLTVG